MFGACLRILDWFLLSYWYIYIYKSAFWQPIFLYFSHYSKKKLRNEPGWNLFPRSAPLNHASQFGMTHEWVAPVHMVRLMGGRHVAWYRGGATLAWVVPSVLTRLSRTDCYGTTDGPYVVWRVGDSRLNRANVFGATQGFKPSHNPVFLLSSLFPSSLSLSQPRDPAAAASFAAVRSLRPATIRSKTRSFSSLKVASRFEPYRFSFYYFYCFV
jgi:hypothetical protein